MRTRLPLESSSSSRQEGRWRRVSVRARQATLEEFIVASRPATFGPERCWCLEDDCCRRRNGRRCRYGQRSRPPRSKTSMSPLERFRSATSTHSAAAGSAHGSGDPRGDRRAASSDVRSRGRPALPPRRARADVYRPATAVAERRSRQTGSRRERPADPDAAALLDRLAALVPPPRVHRHRYVGVLAPNAPPARRRHRAGPGPAAMGPTRCLDG